MDTMPSSATAAPVSLRIIRALAVGSLLALVALSLAWELWIAPIGPSRVGAVKAIPLLFPLVGFLRHRMYTYRWVSLLVWLYFAEGVIRAWGDPVAPRWLPILEIILCLFLFTACALHVRLRLGPRKRKPT